MLNNMQWGDYEMPRVLVLQMMVVNDSNCAVVVVAAVLLCCRSAVVGRRYSAGASTARMPTRKMQIQVHRHHHC